jgi:hypothetical protein
MPEIPWVGLVALVAMFVIPFLPDWLFDGPRTIRHWPHRHVCANCGAPWTNKHACDLDVTEPDPPLRGEIIRPQSHSDLEPLQASLIHAHSADTHPKRGALRKVAERNHQGFA